MLGGKKEEEEAAGKDRALVHKTVCNQKLSTGDEKRVPFHQAGHIRGTLSPPCATRVTFQWQTLCVSRAISPDVLAFALMRSVHVTRHGRNDNASAGLAVI